MRQIDAEYLYQEGNGLSECPVWDAADESLYWVDITGESLFCLDMRTMECKRQDMGKLIGMTALGPEGSMVAALEDCVVLLGKSGRRLVAKNPESGHVPGTCFNDGKCDSLGRLWVGTCNNQGREKAAGLYRIDGDGDVQKMLSGITESNGIDWSPDGRYMYYVDTPSGILWRFDYNLSSGSISNRMPLLDYRQEPGVFDGLTVDAEGNLWVAHWGGFQVSGWNPDTREKIAEIRLPVPNVSCCAFGGKDRRTLFITTSVGRDKSIALRYPLSGAIFRARMDCPGMPCNCFRIKQ